MTDLNSPLVTPEQAQGWAFVVCVSLPFLAVGAFALLAALFP